MFGKNVLRNEIRNLDEKIEKLEIELDKQTSLAKFLLNHKKKDVVANITFHTGMVFSPLYGLKAQYVYNNEIQNVYINLGDEPYLLESVENVNDKVSVIKIKNATEEFEYYYLDKVSNTMFKITEFTNYISNICKIANKKQNHKKGE